MHESGLIIGRRGLLGLGAAGAITGLAPTARGASRVSAPDRPTRGTARNVIFLVVDGMSAGTFTLGEMMRDVRGMGRSHWSRVWDRQGVRRAMCKTHSADGWVTDSAAAGSAWGIGEHINNSAMNFTPDGRMPEPLLVTARAIGKATGLVTTTRVTHATPASFIANVPDRDLEDDIAMQMLDRRVDVILGGGAKHFDAGALGASDDLRVVRTRAEMLAEHGSTGRLLGLFRDDHLGYALDRTPEQPGLPEMSRVALDRLSAAPDGFVLQIEGGRVDHGAHENDAPATVYDQIEFDETIGVVLDWAADRDDTLVVITTDHGNANPGLTYYGKRGVKSLETLAGAQHTYEWINAETKRTGGGFDAMVQSLHTAMNVTLTDSEIGILRSRIVDGVPVDAFDIANGTGPVLGSVLANHFGVAFISPNHTADHVETTAFGPGSETMPHMIDNVDLHHMVLAALSERYAMPWRA